MSLLSSKNDEVVAESIVALKHILQMPRGEGISYDAVIRQLTRLFAKVHFVLFRYYSLPDFVFVCLFSL
jgi:hypothetical protein